MESLSKEMKIKCNFMLPKGFSLPTGRFLLLRFTAVSETSRAVLRTKTCVFTSEITDHITSFVHHLNKTDSSRVTTSVPTILLHTQEKPQRHKQVFSELAL